MINIFSKNLVPSRALSSCKCYGDLSGFYGTSYPAHGYNLIHVASDSAKPALKLLGERVLHMKKSSESRGGG